MPGVCGGKACIADHIEEIQQEMRAGRAFAEEVRRVHPSLVEAKLRQERLEDAS